MKQELTRLSREYATALHKHLKQGPRASLLPAGELGRQAVALGLETLDVAQIHEAALATLPASSSRNGMIKRAELFFAEAITPIETTHRSAREARLRVHRLTDTLDQRTVSLAASNRCLKLGIVQRKTAETALKKSKKRYTRLLEESRQLQKHLRHLTHRIISSQEDERKKISRELHDEVAQTLLGINVRLLALKKETTLNTKGLRKRIASVQQLVEQSVQSINQFARELDIHQ